MGKTVIRTVQATPEKKLCPEHAGKIGGLTRMRTPMMASGKCCATDAMGAGGG
jgi:hypothetical protein